ncbi:MAG TPA: amidophosphoribosyltransferase [Chloroflexota bacterium]|nr:amidophosphoribosyltransferase [Chloroflexota bacterium]
MTIKTGARDTDQDKLHEACGVFGIFGRGEDAARITFFGLHALQHRGQESAGIVAGDGHRLTAHLRMGLVSQVFTEEDLLGLRGHIAVGHTRYSTTGSSKLNNAQPIVVRTPSCEFAVAHNGNLVNSAPLREKMLEEGYTFRTTTDTELIARLFCEGPGQDLLDRIRRAVPRLQGAYSLVMATPDQLFALRDPVGVRPLCLGRLNSAWVVASESCALATVGATYVREVEPGELLVIDDQGVETYQVSERESQATCIFEYIYFARPDSVINNRLVYLARQEMGRELAREHPADADIVIAVPDSAVPGGIGYAQESGIPFAEGLVKNRYIGRTFIQPDQRLREMGIHLKLNPLPEVLADKRVVVVDDSIVRGSTTKPIVRLLREAGAKEVHVRIHAPPMRHPCYLGVDTARRNELIAAQKSVDEIKDFLGADSLGYLSLDGLVRAVKVSGSRLCQGCFTGHYPVPVQLDFDKFALESRDGCCEPISEQMVEPFVEPAPSKK